MSVSVAPVAVLPPGVRRTGLICAVIGAIAFSGKAIIVKLAYRHGVDAITLIMYRMLFALPLFVIMAWWAGRGKPALTLRDWLAVVALGFCGYYLSSYLDFAGLSYISAGLERLILYLNPTLVLALGWLLYRKVASARQLLGLAISYAGVMLVFGMELYTHGAGQQVGWGATLVFLSAVSYAIYLVYSAQYVKRLGALRLVGLATSFACLFCIAQFLLTRPLQAAQVDSAVIWLSVLNATLCTAVPVLLVMLAVERLGAATVAQTGMIGPLSTILMGVWLLGEPLTPVMVAGTALVLTGIYVFTHQVKRP
ncbi:DMT family transporter [Comamonas piscis]|uniref:DMT family transporter n=1 Tax=Comamonas piscis TaxID=1562974 RepID=A0A7G5EBH4_9BURK|nr:DMT family transporter [Comamonas piscis]QMV71349.1 DMT family transporter [Comamonas piscis]WSO33270.1 DMT family transporter [Comamonas piscis]